MRMKKILILLLVFLLSLAMAACSNDDPDETAGDSSPAGTDIIERPASPSELTPVAGPSPASPNEPVPPDTQRPASPSELLPLESPEPSLTFGDRFQFNGSSGLIEIGLGTDVFWGEIDNSWSNHYGATVFGIPITVRNVSFGTGGLNPFDLTVFGSSGLILESVGTFFDHDIALAGVMRAGASQTGLLYFLYDGDGEYVVEFSAGFGLGDSHEAIFQIERASGPHISAFDMNAFPPSTFLPLAAEDVLSLGDAFDFSGSSGDIEIAFGTSISWKEHHRTIVFFIPVSITNIGTRIGGLNPFDIVQFGSRGTRMESVGFFFDDDIIWAGEMSPGATQTGYFYFFYDGNGQYAMEFTAGFGFGEVVEVVFDFIK